MAHEVKAALSSYIDAEAVFRRCLDAKSDRLFLIGKSAAIRNAALDRYQKAVERRRSFTRHAISIRWLAHLIMCLRCYGKGSPSISAT